jgi:hypothetical protein
MLTDILTISLLLRVIKEEVSFIHSTLSIYSYGEAQIFFRTLLHILSSSNCHPVLEVL